MKNLLKSFLIIIILLGTAPLPLQAQPDRQQVAPPNVTVSADNLSVKDVLDKIEKQLRA